MKSIFTTAISSITCAFVLAAPSDELRQTLERRYPATRFDSVTPAELPGIFEVTMGKNTAYTDKDGHFWIFGSIYDMKSKVDLAAQRRSQSPKASAESLVLADAITVKRGNGRRELAVFTDIDCPYCRQLERELAKLEDVTIRYYLHPLAGLHPDATRKSVAVWCTKDKARALREAMDGKDPGSSSCENPLERNMALGKALQIEATPAIMRRDGVIAMGLKRIDELEKWLDGAK